MLRGSRFTITPSRACVRESKPRRKLSPTCDGEVSGKDIDRASVVTIILASRGTYLNLYFYTGLISAHRARLTAAHRTRGEMLKAKHTKPEAPKPLNPYTIQLPIGSSIVPFCGLYLGPYKVSPRKELLWSLWVPMSFSSQMTCWL